MAIAPVTYLEDSETKHTTGFYTADSEGNVMYCDTTEPVGDWSLKSVFQLRTTSDAIVPDEPVAIPHALLVAETSAQAQWVFGGTADLMAPDTSEERMTRRMS